MFKFRSLVIILFMLLLTLTSGSEASVLSTTIQNEISMVNKLELKIRQSKRIAHNNNGSNIGHNTGHKILRDGVDVGNGGDAIVCRDQNGKIIRAEQFDFYEARTIRNINYKMGDKNVDPLEKVFVVIRKLERLDPILAANFKKRAQDFFNLVQFIEDSDLTDIPDSGEMAIPRGCKLEQVAIARAPQFEDDTKIFYINKDIYEAMDNDHKAGLILHEIIYQEFIKRGQQNSIKARYFNSKITSEFIDNVTLTQYFYFTHKLKVIPVTDIIADMTPYSPKKGDGAVIRDSYDGQYTFNEPGINELCVFAKGFNSYTVVDRLEDQVWILKRNYYGDLISGDAKKCSVYMSATNPQNLSYSVNSPIASGNPTISRVTPAYQMNNLKRSLLYSIEDGSLIDINRVKERIGEDEVTLYERESKYENMIDKSRISPYFFFSENYKVMNNSKNLSFDQHVVPENAMMIGAHVLPIGRYFTSISTDPKIEKTFTDKLYSAFPNVLTNKNDFPMSYKYFEFGVNRELSLSYPYPYRLSSFGMFSATVKSIYDYSIPVPARPIVDCEYKEVSMYSISANYKYEITPLEVYKGKSKIVSIIGPLNQNPSPVCLEHVQKLKNKILSGSEEEEREFIFTVRTDGDSREIDIINIGMFK
ncbi:MAG: hypothetical protein HQK49_11305 [Oligoflexia bacterium]|nr:hypothetical protein [Oligoflexia bacterium]